MDPYRASFPGAGAGRPRRCHNSRRYTHVCVCDGWAAWRAGAFHLECIVLFTMIIAFYGIISIFFSFPNNVHTYAGRGVQHTYITYIYIQHNMQGLGVYRGRRKRREREIVELRNARWLAEDGREQHTQNIYACRTCYVTRVAKRMPMT